MTLDRMACDDLECVELQTCTDGSTPRPDINEILAACQKFAAEVARFGPWTDVVLVPREHLAAFRTGLIVSGRPWETLARIQLWEYVDVQSLFELIRELQQRSLRYRIVDGSGLAPPITAPGLLGSALDAATEERSQMTNHQDTKGTKG